MLSYPNKIYNQSCKQLIIYDPRLTHCAGRRNTYCRNSLQSLLHVIILIQTVVMVQTKLIEARGAAKRRVLTSAIVSSASHLKAHLLRATLSVKFLLTVVAVLAREAAARQRAVLAMNDILC